MSAETQVSMDSSTNVLPEKPNADQAGGEPAAGAVVAETEPKGDTAHQLIQLADAEWLVEEGKKCSYWTDVTVSTVDGLILITKELQRIDAPDQRWQCATSSEHPTRYATVDMDLDPPLTVAKVGTFRVLFFCTHQTANPGRTIRDGLVVWKCWCCCAQAADVVGGAYAPLLRAGSRADLEVPQKHTSVHCLRGYQN